MTQLLVTMKSSTVEAVTEEVPNQSYLSSINKYEGHKKNTTKDLCFFFKQMMKGTTTKRYTLVSLAGQDLFKIHLLAIFGYFLAILDFKLLIKYE